MRLKIRLNTMYDYEYTLTFVLEVATVQYMYDVISVTMLALLVDLWKKS